MGPLPRLLAAAFEQRAVDVLAAGAGLLLRRRGGPGDAGVDLLGRFQPHAAVAMRSGDTEPAPVPLLTILAQCKSEARPAGPVHVRELEGVLSAAAAAAAAAAGAMIARGGSHPHRHFGLLISASPFSPQAVRRGAASAFPLALLHLDASPAAGTRGGAVAASAHACVVSRTASMSPELRDLLDALRALTGGGGR